QAVGALVYDHFAVGVGVADAGFWSDLPVAQPRDLPRRHVRRYGVTHCVACARVWRRADSRSSGYVWVGRWTAVVRGVALHAHAVGLFRRTCWRPDCGG